jgi:hypothetical protein
MDNPNPAIKDLTQSASELVSDDKTAWLGMYDEICKSHQAIDEFRMKRLGLLPLASLAGIFVLSKFDILSSTSGSTSEQQLRELVAFIAIFASLFTLALFVYEIRGILKCCDLIESGYEIEKKLGVFGQFTVCKQEHGSATNNDGAKQNRRHRIFNGKVAACFIYALVFAAWVFLALHFGFGLNNLNCMITAPASGLVLGFGAYWIIKEQIPS